VLTGFMLWIEESLKGDYDKDRAWWAPKKAVARSVNRTRWLTSESQDLGELALLEPLADIPSARFARLGDGHIQFLVAAGRRVLLVAPVRWPSGVYARLGIGTNRAIADELAAIVDAAMGWQQLLEPAKATVEVAILVRPLDPACEIELRFSHDNGTMFATPDTFDDIAGAFLAEEPYDLNMEVLARIRADIESASQEVRQAA
jgi:hypothetical protein